MILDVINVAPLADMAQSIQASVAEAGINFEILPGTGSQVAMGKNVNGYVNGATSDFVYYRLVTKD